MGRIGRGIDTNADKLKDIRETITVDQALIKHYNFVLGNYDNLIAAQDKEIAVIEKKKVAILKEFDAAPLRIKELQQHLAEMQTKYSTLKDLVGGKKQKIKQLKTLKERIAKLQQELKADGVDIEECEAE